MAKVESTIAKVSNRKKVRLYDKCDTCKESIADMPMVFIFPRLDRPVHEACNA